MVGTLWALLPALIAIILALITKQVYVSLFLGLLVGAFCCANGNFLVGMEKLVECLAENTGEAEHIYILTFTLCLGILVVLITMSGGSKAYGEWATKKIKTKKGALLATYGLGLIIFIDDYFNCLTVGNVMRPVTDKNKVSRAKLAYIIDSLAAPMCIIMPISSWAAAVGTSLNVSNGFEVFIKSIPFNLYAILTMVMVFIVCVKKFDIGLMKKLEDEAENQVVEEKAEEKIGDIVPNPNGKVIDLLLPIIFLIITSIFFMLYTGGILEGNNIIESFSNCDAGKSLSISSLLTLLFTSIYYSFRKVVSFEEIGESIVEGFKTMAPTLLILILAWSLGSMCSSVHYLSLSTSTAFDALKNIGFLFPAIIFVISALIAFSTGTSWGTFAILLPLVPQFIQDATNPLFFVSIAAVLGGAVCGDHISPISDTTILSSTGASCNHLDHVKTQMPYAITICCIVFISYLLLGILSLVIKANYSVFALISLGFGLIALFSVVLVLSKIKNKNKVSSKENIEENK